MGQAGFFLTAQFADKPTRGQSSRELDNLWTSQLADSELKKIMELLYLICTLNSNPIEYWQCINSVICPK